MCINQLCTDFLFLVFSQVCAVLPDKEHDKCVSTITGFGPMALNYVIGLTSDPQNACSMIDMCP